MKLLCFLSVFLLLTACDKDTLESTEVRVVLTNTSGYNFTDLELGWESDSERVLPAGFEGASYSSNELPNGSSITLELPDNRKFAWGRPNPTHITALTVDGRKAILWDGYWCGTGYFEEAVKAGQYDYTVEFLSQHGPVDTTVLGFLIAE